MSKVDIKSLFLSELEQEIAELNEKSFRAKQVYTWLHQNHVVSFDEMSNVSKSFRHILSEKFDISKLNIVDKLESRKDGTIKYLFDIGNKTIIESVFMKYSFGNSVCVSSQAGCRMGCKFCASTIGGLDRNLSAGEMLEQVYSIKRDTSERVSNVVIMGCGEPLDNYDQALRFIKLLSCENEHAIGQRNITLSTCGVVPEIYRLAKERLQITLAISLHAPNDEVRRKIMPIAKKYPIKDVLKASEFYFNYTKRRITYEYALISGINDKQDHAIELARILSNKKCHVNLIPVNAIQEQDYNKSNEKSIDLFSKVLKKYKIEATVRRELGNDINAACGQLRKTYIERGV